MKLTKKSVTTEVETTEIVCEIAKDEFDKICAETAAHTIVDIIGDEPDTDDIMCGVELTKFLAKFVAKLAVKLFNDKTENPDKKEEK